MFRNHQFKSLFIKKKEKCCPFCLTKFKWLLPDIKEIIRKMRKVNPKQLKIHGDCFSPNKSVTLALVGVQLTVVYILMHQIKHQLS